MSNALFKVQLVVYYEFTVAELDQILAAPNGTGAYVALNRIMESKRALPEHSAYNVEQVIKAGGEFLLKERQAGLRMLKAAPTDA